MGNCSKFLLSHSSTFKELWALTFAIKYYADKGQIRQLLRSDGFSVDALAHIRWRKRACCAITSPRNRGSLYAIMSVLLIRCE